MTHNGLKPVCGVIRVNINSITGPAHLQEAYTIRLVATASSGQDIKCSDLTSVVKTKFILSFLALPSAL